MMTTRAAALALLVSVSTTLAQTRDELVNNDHDALADSTEWIYNDLDRGFAEAKKTNKPLFVSLRCIP